MKFLNRHIEIEAIQWTGTQESFAAIKAFAGDAIEPSCAAPWCNCGHPLLIDTLECRMTAQKGDWIIRGVKGEYYPCKPDIFNELYEPA